MNQLWWRLRWVVIGLSLLLGVALLVTVGLSYRTTEDVSRKVARAEGMALLHGVRRSLSKRGRRRVQKSDLKAVFREFKQKHLLYLGIYQHDGTLLLDVGKTSEKLHFPLPRRRRHSKVQFLTESRVRLVVSLHLRRRGRTFRRLRRWLIWRQFGLHRPRRAGPTTRRTIRRWRRPRPVLVLEFLSETVQDVRRESQRILLFGGGLILALLLLLTVFGVVMKRLSRLEEERQKQEQLAVLGEMSAVLAHEIRNPLTSLKGQAQLLEEFLPEDSKLKTKASKVVQEALRLEQLSSQLLDFVKTGVLETASVELKSLFDEVLVSFEEQQVSLSLELATQQWRLDPVKLRQVLTNLLNNAVQASPEKGTVSIRVFEKASSLHIRVEDRGEGIPEENLVSIFTPFVTTRVQGTGLGLPVARRLVELHQGTLSASNREQGGASFEIVLPRN